MHIKEGKKQKRGGGTDEQSGKQQSSNLNLSFSGVQKKIFFVKKMKEKRVTFCFIKLNANRFLNIASGKQLYNKKDHQKLNHF